MDRHVEWDCEGCGAHVFAFGTARVPLHQFCATCLWFNENLDPEEMVAVMRELGLLGEEKARNG
jgi:hypothetical protein